MFLSQSSPNLRGVLGNEERGRKEEMKERRRGKGGGKERPQDFSEPLCSDVQFEIPKGDILNI